MKTKELKKYLKSEVDKITLPDLSDNILSNTSFNLASQEVKTKPKRKWLYFMLPSFTLVAVVIILLVIFIRPNNNVRENLLNSSKEVIGKEIILASSILDENSNIKAKLSYNTNKLNEDIDLINEYLETANLIINEESKELLIYLNDNSDYPYKYYMTNVSETLKFYYNETSPYYEDDLDEVSIDFSGVLIIDEQIYDIKGHRENEDNEEFNTDIYIYQNDNLILSIEQETEHKENEYTYTYYRLNKAYLEVNQNVEYEDGNKKMSIEIEQNNLEREISFVYFKDYILCEYESEEGELEIELEEIYIYEYESYYLYKFPNTNIPDIKKNKNF